MPFLHQVEPWLKESDILMDNEVSKKPVNIVGSDAYLADACTQLMRPILQWGRCLAAHWNASSMCTGQDSLPPL